MSRQVILMKDLPSHLFSDKNDRTKFTPDSSIITESDLDQLNLSIKALPSPRPISVSWSFGQGISFRRLRILTSSSILQVASGVTGACNISLWDKSSLSIGANSSFSGIRIVLDRTAKCETAENLLVSDGVLLQVGDQHALVDLESREVINTSSPCLSIGRHVWLGRDAKIISSKTLHIGSGSVVAMGSIVTSSIAVNTLNAGVPSRKIRENISWHRSRHPTDQEINDLVSDLHSFL
jgi:acetyltransferase-like isoleucine patch superfamily enzyme